MPKSRRDRAIALTKTTKKQGLEPKEKTIESVRSLVDQYERIFVYSLDNSRNNHWGGPAEQVTGVVTNQVNPRW